MKKFWDWFASPVAKDYTSNSGYIYKRVTSILFILTIIIVTFLCVFLRCNLLTGIVTFLLVAAASSAGGAAIGFLFGLPKAEKYRFVKKDDIDQNNKDYSYGDNTNLEEVSDWLTKIIVGITLIKLNTIIGWIDKSAHSIDHAFNSSLCDKEALPLNAYVFGYCTIILYFLAGAGLCYLWARTNLSVLLTVSKIAQRDIEKQQLIAKIQSLTNPELQTTDGATVSLKTESLSDEQKSKSYPSVNFRNLIESVYNAKSIIDKSDLQKGRWGGEAKKGDFILEGNYIASSIIPGVYKVQLLVRSLNINNPLKGEVAFFIHDSFPSEIVFTLANNNKAEITISAYESFVAGARLEDGTELELDLNKVKGFPEGFYWKD